jgi:transposase
MPHKAGDRGTTDRRDAGPLARLARSGALPVVSGPPGAEAALRALPRARAAARSEGKDAQGRLNAGLRRPVSRSIGRAHWGPAHLRWLAEVVCPPPAPPIVFQAEGRAVTAHAARRQRLAQELHEHGHA